MEFIYLIFFYACLRLRFLDVETNPGPQWPVPTVCRLLCCNVRGLAGNLSEMTVAPSQYNILLCSETLVSDMHHVSELLAPGLGRPVLLSQGRMPRARGMMAYVQDGYGALCHPKFECCCRGPSLAPVCVCSYMAMLCPEKTYLSSSLISVGL